MMMEDEKIEPYRISEGNRKMTQKGAEFTLENKSKNRYGCYKSLSTLNDNLQKMFFSKDDKETVGRAYSEWLDKCKEFLVSKYVYNFILAISDEEKDEYFMDLNKKVSRGLVYETFKKRYD